jgi:hypothetical protein
MSSPESKAEARKKIIKRFTNYNEDYDFLRRVSPYTLPSPPSIGADVSTRRFAGLVRTWKILVHLEAQRLRNSMRLPPERSSYHYPALKK